jgi:hypothetical protein
MAVTSQRESATPHPWMQRDMVFPGALVALLFGIAERSLVGPVVMARARQSMPGALDLVSGMLWAGTVLAPVFFFAAAVVSAGLLWAAGELLDERGSFRELLNVCALAEMVRMAVLLALVALARLGLLGSDSVLTGTALGMGFVAGDSLVRSAYRGLLSPAVWLWMATVAVLLRRGVKWSSGGALVASSAILLVRVLAAAIRTQHSFPTG